MTRRMPILRRAPGLGARNYFSLFRLIAFVPIVAGCVYLLFLMPPVPSIAVLTATVETMTFRVIVAGNGATVRARLRHVL